MAAITLGLAEVEERLEGLRRRLNFATAQHSIYLAMTALFAVATVLVLTGLRASPSTFRLVALGGGILIGATVLLCALYARRHWLDAEAVARLADARGDLTDRLATLTDLRLRPRPSRLAPVLVTQALALREQWQPRRIAPRLIPRSVLFLVAALLALTGTVITEHQPPEPAAAALAESHMAVTGSKPAETGSPRGADSTARSTRRGSVPQQALQPAADAVKPPRAEPALLDRKPAGSRGLSDQLQRAIQETFRPAPSSAETSGADSATSARHDRNSVAAAERKGSGGNEHAASQPGSKAAGRGPSSPGAVRHQAANSGQFASDDSPGAGQGSNPEGLMKSEAPAAGTISTTRKPFQVTITSFLRAAGPQGRQPGPSGQPAGSGTALAAREEQAALSNVQQPDEALRKAEIPPDYEDLVRRVFSLRPLR